MDNYYWEASHKDGKITRFNPEDPQSAELLSKEEIVEFRLVPQKSDLKPVTISLDIEKGERFIRFRRMVTKFFLGGLKPLPYGFQPGLNTIDVVGIRRADGESVYLYVRPDGSMRLSTSNYGE